MSDEKKAEDDNVEELVTHVDEQAETSQEVTGLEVDTEARRKLEEALEERRLQKEIQDYDFDLD